MIIDFMKKHKLFSLLVIIFSISFILGCSFIFFISEENKEIIKTSINLYFTDLNKINYIDNFVISLINNISLSIIIWLLGISIFGCFIVFIIYFIKGFVISFSFSSIIFVYGFRGVILSLVYSLCYFINLGILFILSYYAVSFSILLFKYFFKNKDYNRKIIVRRYIKVLCFCILGLIFSSIIDSFLIPRILLLF